jgi:hypothetical protein
MSTFNIPKIGIQYDWSHNLVVAKSGGDYAGIKEAIDAIENASSTEPWRVFVAPGIYDEDPFTIPSYVKVEGCGWQATIIKSTDLSNHFITLDPATVIKDVCVYGPTALGKAAVYHTASSLSGVTLSEIVISRGYYGFYSNPTVSRGPSIVSNVLFAYDGVNPIENFIRSEGYADITTIGCIAAAQTNKIVKGYVAIGVSASLTLVTSEFECGGTTDAVYVNNGASCRMLSCLLIKGENAIHVGPDGTSTITATGTKIQNLSGSGFTNDIYTETTTAKVHFNGAATRDRFNIIAGSNDINASFQDLTSGSEGSCTIGEFRLGVDQNVLTPLTAYGNAAFYTGIVSGSLVTRSGSTGFVLNIAAGNGFINDGTVTEFLSWSGGTVTLNSNSTEYVYVDHNAVFQHTTSQPDYATNIVLAQAVTDVSGTVLLTHDEIPIAHGMSRIQEYLEDIIGPMCISGIVATTGSTALTVNLSSGSFYSGLNERDIDGGAPITFTYWHRDGSGGWIAITGSTTIDSGSYDNGNKVAMTADKFKKDALYVISNCSGSEYHVVYGQEQFNTEVLAMSGSYPSVPSVMGHYGMRSSGIIVSASLPAVANPHILSVVDARPFLGQSTSTTALATGDHDLLINLDHDTHLQYLTSGRAATWLNALPGDTNNLVSNGNNHDHVGGDGAQIDHTGLSNKGVNTHAQIDTHITDMAARQVIAGAGLTGGGNLTADRTFDVIAADGSITVNANSIQVGVISDTQHGSRNGGTLHAVATTSSNGFFSGSDKAKLDGIASSATYTPLAITYPAQLQTSASIGTSTYAAKADHIHSHGNLTSGSLHAVATTSSDGFMSSSDKVSFNSLSSSYSTFSSSHVFGNDFQSATDNTRTTLAGNTYPGLTKATLATTVLSGTYKLSFNVLSDCAVNNRDYFVRIQNITNATMIWEIVDRTSTSTIRHSIGGFKYVTLTGSNTYRFEAKGTNAGDTVGLTSASIEIYRIS